MISKLNINWLNKCRCGNRMHKVETVRGSHVRLFEDDAVKCNSCGRKGGIQTCDGMAMVLWETDEERAEGEATSTSTLTRNELNEVVATYGKSHIAHRMAKELLAAMDSEPVATLDVQSGRSDGNKFALAFSSAAHRLPDDVYFLYRHAKPVPDALIEAVDFYEQVKRENPSVETGAYKDAVEWVLKEACLSVIKDE